MNFKVFTIGLLTLPILGFGQNTILKNEIETIEEREIDFEVNETPNDYLPPTEKTNHYLKHPINLNKASWIELKNSRLFHDREINAILDYREKYYGFIEIEELKAIPLINHKRFIQIAPFISIKQSSQKEKLKLSNGSHIMMLRFSKTLEKQAAFRNQSFFGDEWQHYIRYNYHIGKELRTGFTLEKDVGEAISSSVKNPLYYDFASFHFSYDKQKGLFKGAFLGDYSLKLGQGLHFWNGMGFRKLATAINTKRNQTPITSYRSSNEWNFLRGSSIQFGEKNWTLSPFFSLKKRDASYNYDSIFNTTSINIQTTGLHRSRSELANKNRVKEKVLGGRFEYEKKRFQIGITQSSIIYNKIIQKTAELYNAHTFKGKQLNTSSIDYKVIGNKIENFGELAYNGGTRIAFLDGLNLHISNYFTLNITYRNYSKSYFNPYANGFGDKSTTNNEKGIYIGTQYHINTNWWLSAYYDSYQFIWSSYNSIAPSKGKQYLLQMHYEPKDKISMYWRYKNTQEQENLSTDTRGLKQTQPNNLTQIRYHLIYAPTWFLNLKSRLEITISNKNDKQIGQLLYQDIQYKFPFIGKHKKKNKYPLSLTARIAFAKIEDYGNRIYTYENDVLYAFSIAQYSDESIKYYCLLRYNISKRIKLWFRYSRLSLAKQSETIGSSYTAINGSSKSDIRFQLKYEF